MDELRAAELAAILSASYPGRQIGEANLAVWTAEFAAMAEDTARTVVDKLKYRCTDPPSLAQIRQCLNEAEETTASPRVGNELPAERQTFSEFLERNPEMREQLKKLRHG